MESQDKKGISLLVLIVTIIIVIIIAGAVIFTLNNNNVLDTAKKARFMNDYTNVQDGVNLYSFGKYNATTGEFDLPLKGYLTSEDKLYISESVPTLKIKIEELSGSIDTTNLAWISSEDIGARLSREKTEKGYIIDINNGQIYDYIGDIFEGKRWHTLDGGVVIGDTTIPVVTEELWDGWIKLTLYYPAGSTEKKWRLGTEGELRVDPMLMWQNYTGPIIIPLDRIQDVWIKYMLDNKEVIIPPAGTLLVDIVPDKTGYTKVPGVKVHINFDETATTKEYRVGDSGWITYNGEFSITENCIIEARAKKIESIYNTDGTLLTTRDVAGRDLVYIGNIGIEEAELASPTITRLAPVGEEKARVQVTYPVNADRKIYKVNYGVEENYTTEISVTNYGTYIIAYYYDSSGKRSKASAININDTSTGAVQNPSVIYEVNPPYEPGSPIPPYVSDINILAPTVIVNPTTLVEEVQVSIDVPANADKVYIKLGRYGQYQLYTSPIIVRQNMEVYAYYRTYAGERSDTGYGTVSNIKKNNKPYVYIDANPYPYTFNYGASTVTVTINYSDADTVEYSEDGIIYNPYTAPFTVTENKRIYARATNVYGVTETSLNITNIGKIKVPVPIGNLAISINVNPEPSISTTRVAKANVTIDYDSKAIEKYYSIGKYGTLQTYTGSFEVTSNCTIYAYAKGVNAKGQIAKKIDNLSTGITDPIIIVVPGNNEQASKVNVTIEFDKYSTIKRYSIDGGSLRDYTASFEVTKNGSVVYAYSENELGQKSESSYIIENIVPQPPVLVIDKGQYYILKLNYPPTSKNREYKWKEDGEWKGYKEAGILLLKPEYKNQLLQGGTLVKIEDENGNLVTFTGDYYFIDVPISEMFENLFMRWDREPLSAPQILISPIEPAIGVTVNIVYNTNLVTKQYKIVNPDGSLNKDWTDYTGPITIDRNNTLIYAKGMDDTEVWTAESMEKVINIDENSPVIKLTADLDTAQQKVAIKVNVTDDVLVGKVKWVAGIQGESYFINSGTEITNDSIVNITSNGYYTFYAEDQVGNKQVYTLNVTNVDLTPPVIDIQVTPETTVGLTANITVNYGDSTLKQYKIGTSNAIWTNYESTFTISSYTILANNWQNLDGTVTIYAKGKDIAGNEVIVQKKVVSLDLDRPDVPVITSNASYPVLTSYGVILDATTTITYDTRTDIDNYYSIDNGVIWNIYTGSFDYPAGTIIAKSIKKSTGLEVSVSKTVAMPSDAIGINAYDNNSNTYFAASGGAYNLLVDSSLIGKEIRIEGYHGNFYNNGGNYIAFLNSSMGVIQKIAKVNTGNSYAYDEYYTIPSDTKYIQYYTVYAGNQLNEIQLRDEPMFTATDVYILLHPDPTKAIKTPYKMVSIGYFPTSVERLYKIGTTLEWTKYNEQPIKVAQGETLYAKGIDQYGNETRAISSYTVNVTNALTSVVCDDNYSTYFTASGGAYNLMVDSSLIGKKIRIKGYHGNFYNNGGNYIAFLNSSMEVIQKIAKINTGNNYTYDEYYTIPSDTKYIQYYTIYAGNQLYEIQLCNEPTFVATNGYMLLHLDTAQAIKTPYKMISINYFPTSIQKLYRIGTEGEWISYSNQEIKVNQGETLYAKGIDQYGNETRIISSYTVNVIDALTSTVYDGDYVTYFNGGGGPYYIIVDSSIIGKTVNISGYHANYSGNDSNYIAFLNSNKTVIQKISKSNTGNSYNYNTNYIIPAGTTYIQYNSTYSGNKLYEIKPL